MSTQTPSLLHFFQTVDAAKGARVSSSYISRKWGGRGIGRVVIIKVHFPLSEAGWGLGQPEGVPGQLPPLIWAPGKAPGEGYSSHSMGSLCSYPEQPAAWPTADHGSRGVAFHGSMRLTEIRSLQLTPRPVPTRTLVSQFGSGTSPKVSPSPALWQLLWVRSALNGLSSPSGDHVPRMRRAGRGWSPGARDEVRKGMREDWIPQFVFGGSGSSGPG